MRIGTLAAISIGLCASVVVVLAQSIKVDFEKDEVGRAPRGFSFPLTGQGKPGMWVVKKDDRASGNVLVQTDADSTDYRFPMAIFNDFTAKDADLSMRFKAISGRV